MDGSRFDALTRTVAVSSRRRLLARLAGVTAAAVMSPLARRSGVEAQGCADLGQTCGAQGLACCTGTCSAGSICCAVTSGNCIADADCCLFDPSGDSKVQFCNLPGTNNSACLYCTENQPCTSDDDCCVRSHTCQSDGNGGSVCTPPCRAANESCTGDADCCPGLGLTCLNTAGAFFCGFACTAEGNACADSSECCDDQVCNDDVCGPAVVCSEQGEACHNDGDCCNSLVCLGAICGPLPTCEAEGGECGKDGDCCTGLTCQDGECAPPPPTCQDNGQHCADANECCDGLTCQDGICTAPTCSGAGDSCAEDTDCCAELTCESGVCTAPSDGSATVTIHNATCPRGTGGDIFEACHGNGQGGVGFDVNGVAITTDGNGVAGIVVGVGSVTVTESTSTFGNDLGAYVYCKEQNGGTVLYDGSADSGSVTFTVNGGDDVICDWYNLTETIDDNDEATTPPTTVATTFPVTGTGVSDNAPSSWLGAAALGGVAALIAAKKLRDSTGSDTPAS